MKRLIASTLAFAFVAAVVTISAQTTGTTKQTTPKPPAAKTTMAPKLDINSAPKDKLVTLGFTDTAADALIKGRPYKTTTDLVTKKVVDQATFDKLKTKIVATQAKAK